MRDNPTDELKLMLNKPLLDEIVSKHAGRFAAPNAAIAGLDCGHGVSPLVAVIKTVMAASVEAGRAACLPS